MFHVSHKHITLTRKTNVQRLTEKILHFVVQNTSADIYWAQADDHLFTDVTMCVCYLHWNRLQTLSRKIHTFEANSIGTAVLTSKITQC